MGRKCETVHKTFESLYNTTAELDVELFPWEKLDMTEKLRTIFSLQ